MKKMPAFSGTGAERAAELMRFFNDPEVEEIYDISGGDLANQVLDGWTMPPSEEAGRFSGATAI